MQILHAIDIEPEQYVAEEHEKRIRPPACCPHCQRLNTLKALGYYARSLSRLEAGVLSLFVRRLRCCVCRKTVSLLPAFAQPYRLIQNRTIEYFVLGTPFSDEVIRHLDLLSRYWKQFLRGLPEIAKTLGKALDRAPPHHPREAWEFIIEYFQGLNTATKILTSSFQITLFGRYRCHRPNNSEEN
jgi:hypothetical protein